MLRNRLPLFIGLSLALAPSLAFSGETQDSPSLNPAAFQSKERIGKSELNIGLQYARVDTSPTLSGLGINIDFGYGFSPSWQISAGLSQIFYIGGTASLYTGFYAKIHYAIFGSFWNEEHDILDSHGTLISHELSSRTNTFSLSLGPEQLIINGTSQIYPATGFVGGVEYGFAAFSHRFVGFINLASLTENQKNITAFCGGVSVLFGL